MITVNICQYIVNVLNLNLTANLSKRQKPLTIQVALAQSQMKVPKLFYQRTDLRLLAAETALCKKMHLWGEKIIDPNYI